jgi:hypothetical protein
MNGWNQGCSAVQCSDAAAFFVFCFLFCFFSIQSVNYCAINSKSATVIVVVTCRAIWGFVPSVASSSSNPDKLRGESCSVASAAGKIS